MKETMCRHVNDVLHLTPDPPRRRTPEEAALLLEALIEWHQDGAGLQHHCEGCILVDEIVKLRKLVARQQRL